MHTYFQKRNRPWRNILITTCVSLLLSCIEELPIPPPDPINPNPPTILSAPFNGFAQAALDYVITLQWEDSSTYAISVVVQTLDTSNTFVTLDTLDSITTDTIRYVDKRTNAAHSSHTYRAYSYFDTLVSVFSDTVTVEIPNNIPKITIKNYQSIVNAAYRVGDTVIIQVDLHDDDGDSLFLVTPTTGLTVQDSFGVWVVKDTVADTLVFIGSDRFGGSDTATVLLSYLSKNHAPQFHSVVVPSFSVAEKKARCTYAITEPDNDPISLFVNTIVEPGSDPRQVTLLQESNLFTFIPLKTDTGETEFSFIVQDPWLARDTVVDTLLVVLNSSLFFNTAKHDTVVRLARYDVDGKNGHYLTRNEEGLRGVGYPIVSFDNWHLAYTKEYAAYQTVSTIQADGLWDKTLFIDSAKVVTPGSWSSDGTKIALKVDNISNSTWRVVTYSISQDIFDTIFSGIALSSQAGGPLFASDDTLFIINNNDSLFTLSLNQGLTLVAPNASHPQIVAETKQLFYTTRQGSVLKLMRSELSGQGALEVADFGDYSIDYTAIDNKNSVLYGLAFNESNPQKDHYGWVYFCKTNRFEKITLEIEEGVWY